MNTTSNSARSDTELRAGAGRSAIVYPSAAWPLDGFDSEHDPLYARVLVTASAGRTIVLAVVDQTSLQPEFLAEVAGVLAQVAGVEKDAVIVNVSHTFSAPHIMSLDGLPPREAARMALARDAVLAAVRDAGVQAVESLTDARIGSIAGSCDVNVNRDVETPAGWWLGSNASGYADKSLLVIRITSMTGEPIAVLANYAVQSSVMNESIEDDGSRRTTGDLAGAAMHSVETAHSDEFVALFLMGAAGDQAPTATAVTGRVDEQGEITRADLGTAGHALTAALGERLGREVLRLETLVDVRKGSATVGLTAHTIVAPGQVPSAREHIRPTRVYEFIPAASVELPFWILQLGESILVGVQVELSASTAAAIRSASPFASIGVVSMFNGGAKYLPDSSGFDRITYEAMSSRYAQGSAEKLAEAVIAALSDRRP